MAAKKQVALTQFAYRTSEENEIYILDAITQEEAIEEVDEGIKNGDIALESDESVFIYRLSLINEFVVKLQPRIKNIKSYAEEGDQ